MIAKQLACLAVISTVMSSCSPIRGVTDSATSSSNRPIETVRPSIEPGILRSGMTAQEIYSGNTVTTGYTTRRGEYKITTAYYSPVSSNSKVGFSIFDSDKPARDSFNRPIPGLVATTERAWSIQNGKFCRDFRSFSDPDCFDIREDSAGLFYQNDPYRIEILSVIEGDKCLVTKHNKFAARYLSEVKALEEGSGNNPFLGLSKKLGSGVIPRLVPQIEPVCNL